ncbi:uncharacterized protein LOC131164317 [Malania oleifera]|uniref:uncharacterized protein LOC131164317 n=1 Tax=Malania oleifera TaxID=397392 RepID=UPI0025AE669F|nr:uncharacterized protein LOC131164317 [Malania oleifera]
MALDRRPMPRSLRLLSAVFRRKPLPRRRKIRSVRLGGEKARRGFLVRAFSRVRLRWLKLKYSWMLKKLKQYYLSVLDDLLHGGAALDSFQRSVLMETSFAVPVMGISLSTYPSSAAAASSHRRSIVA